MKKKFEQFRGLIAFCENGGFEKQVTVEDLQGFWEVMYIQVCILIHRFSNCINC